MSPTDFAKWIIEQVDKRSEEKARHIVTTTNQTQETIRREISEAQSKHPALKDNQDYRETVLAIMETSNARGIELSLEDACVRVDKLMGITPATEAPKEDKQEPKPIKRAGVEKSSPAEGSGTDTDEDKVKKGIMSAGGSHRGALGGLGI